MVPTDHAVLAWLSTPDARAQASRLARRRQLGGYDGDPGRVLDDATVEVWLRLARGPLDVDNPAAYGTRVIQSVLRRDSAGRDDLIGLHDDDLVDGPDAGGGDGGGDPTRGPAGPSEVAVAPEDDLREALDRLADSRPWLTAAALGWLALAGTDTRPEGAPWPQGGSTLPQARCWPALWFAGEHDLFEAPLDAADGARIRRTRARRIDAVLRRIEAAAAVTRLGPVPGRPSGSSGSSRRGGRRG